MVITFKYLSISSKKSKLFNIESFTFVHSSEMRENLARSYTKICS